MPFNLEVFMKGCSKLCVICELSHKLISEEKLELAGHSQGDIFQSQS